MNIRIAEGSFRKFLRTIIGPHPFGTGWAWVALLPLLLLACSETEDEEANEFGNWQVRNEAFFTSLEDSLRLGSQWMKIKNYTKDETATGKATDYIYARVLETGDGTEFPLYYDSVCIAYRGRYIPTEHYVEGYVFDQTYMGSYDLRTVSTAKYVITSGSLVDGMLTALQHMHKGDRWRVFIPYTMAYGTSDYGSVPAYSTLIFDLTLIDYSHPGEKLPVW